MLSGAARLWNWAQGGCKGRAASLADKAAWTPGTGMLREKLLPAPVSFTLLGQSHESGPIKIIRFFRFCLVWGLGVGVFCWLFKKSSGA